MKTSSIVLKVIESLKTEMEELEYDLHILHNSPSEYHNRVAKIKSVLKEWQLTKITLQSYVNELIPEDFGQESGGDPGAPHGKA